MSEFRGAPLYPFAERYRASFPRFTTYPIDTNGNTIEGTSSKTFARSRGHLMNSLIKGEPQRTIYSQALLAENIVSLALQPALGEEFKATLAPQNLERDWDGKGVDVLISDSEDLVYLGVDVKMRIGKSSRNRDGYGWSDKLRAPYIYLSLGNWSVNMKEGEEVRIADWLNQYTIPKIQQSGQIPQVGHFRDYLIGRIERSINGYRERLREPDLYHHTFGLPPTAAYAELLEEKLAVMQSLFTDLVTS